jgi:hypothetical protein
VHTEKSIKIYADYDLAYNELALSPETSVEVVHPQVLKMTFALQQVIADYEQSMADGCDRPLPSPVGSDSLKEGSKVALLAPGRTPSALPKLLPQPSASFSRLAAETLACAFVVSGTNSSPGSQVVSRGKLVHIDPDFSNHRPSAGPVKTGDLR